MPWSQQWGARAAGATGADYQGGGKGDAGGGGSAGRRAMIAMQEYDDAEKSRFSMWYDGILPLSGKPRWEKRVMGRGGSVDLEGGGIVDDDSSVILSTLVVSTEVTNVTVTDPTVALHATVP